MLSFFFSNYIIWWVYFSVLPFGVPYTSFISKGISFPTFRKISSIILLKYFMHIYINFLFFHAYNSYGFPFYNVRKSYIFNPYNLKKYHWFQLNDQFPLFPLQTLVLHLLFDLYYWRGLFDLYSLHSHYNFDLVFLQYSYPFTKF